MYLSTLTTKQQTQANQQTRSVKCDVSLGHSANKKSTTATRCKNTANGEQLAKYKKYVVRR